MKWYALLNTTLNVIASGGNFFRFLIYCAIEYHMMS